jgi:hypothetical protein
MSDRSKKVTELTALTAPVGDDLLLIIDDVAGTPVTKKVTLTNLLGNSAANVVIHNSTPANSTITVKKGTLMFDSTYLYIATANNQLKRILLTAF